jgi:hypothetical protein
VSETSARLLEILYDRDEYNEENQKERIVSLVAEWLKELPERHWVNTEDVLIYWRGEMGGE